MAESFKPYFDPKDKPPSEETYKEVLPVYVGGLRRLIDHMREVNPGGIFTLGNSSLAMWKDIEAVAHLEDIPLPPSVNVVGYESDNMYGDSHMWAKWAYDRYVGDIDSPMLIEDFVDTGKKFVDLDKFFRRIGLNVPMAALAVGRMGKRVLQENKINCFQAVEQPSPQLLKFLHSRHSPREPLF